MDEMRYNLHFRAVGQGLFSHGHLQFWDDRATKFEWVYDCGADKIGAHLQRQIVAYESHNSDDIDLLMISHFDKDHVLGIQELLKKKKPKVIVAPYLFLSERLAAIAALSPSDGEYIGFLLNPAGALREFAGPNARIVFILPGGAPPPDETGGDSTDPNNPWPRGNLEAGRDHPLTNASGPLQDPNADPDLQRPEVYRIDGSIPFVVKGQWEFCFYNHARPEMEPTLVPLMQAAIDKFQHSQKKGAVYKTLLNQLKSAFDTARGPGKRPGRFDANEISLVVYSGPVRRDEKRCCRCSAPWINCARDGSQIAMQWPWHWPDVYGIHPYFENGRCAALFTGDISLNDATLDSIVKHFGSARVGFAAYFQVPHHGSKLSFKLSPKKLQPDFSIFSSARYHSGYDHPSDKVIADLEEYGPLFVNEFQGVVLGGWLELR